MKNYNIHTLIVASSVAVRSFAHNVLTIIFASIVSCFATSATVAGEPPDITGRWTVKPIYNSTLRPAAGFPVEGNQFDFTRCGEAWCGVEVDKDGKCGRTAFRLSPYDHTLYHFKGLFATFDITQPYTLFVGGGVGKDKDTIYADGDFSRSPERAYPQSFVMSRQGETMCKAEVTTPTGIAWKAPNISGRWIVRTLEEGEVPKMGSLFDITQCGEAWCGVEVDKEGKCGRTAFHFFTAKDLEPEYQFRGQYSASDQIRTEDLHVSSNNVRMWVEVSTGRLPSGRIYGLSAGLDRQGDAVCKAEYKAF